MGQIQPDYTEGEGITELGVVYTDKQLVEGDIIGQDFGNGDGGSINYLYDINLIVKNIVLGTTMTNIVLIENGTLSDAIYTVTGDEEWNGLSLSFTQTVNRLGEYVKHLNEKVDEAEELQKEAEFSVIDATGTIDTLTDQLAESELQASKMPLVLDVEQEVELILLIDTFKKKYQL